jgi:hypothetical protein
MPTSLAEVSSSWIVSSGMPRAGACIKRLLRVSRAAPVQRASTTYEESWWEPAGPHFLDRRGRDESANRRGDEVGSNYGDRRIARMTHNGEGYRMRIEAGQVAVVTGAAQGLGQALAAGA